MDGINVTADELDDAADFHMSPDLFRRLREAQGLTQDELSRLLGVSRRTVIRWETAGPVPRMASMAMLYLTDRAFTETQAPDLASGTDDRCQAEPKTFGM